VFIVKICWPVQNRLPEIGVVAWLMTLAWWIPGRRTTRASPRGYGDLPIIVVQALFRARPARRRKTNAPAPSGGDKAQGG